jgi:diaminohydroxyphosphoribosylaminopyrimidine deaminase/5-amino-6-(5-phosphoribosylamino)uracil reductase
MVGAVLVRGNKIIATGYHRRAGEDHAEIVALKRAKRKARGATLYINLEPCTHHGKTPPCTTSLIDAGIKKVVAGTKDPNPLVSGQGIRKLKRAGIQVDVGLLEAECQRLNEAFKKYITRRTPFVILKLAASLDGKIATSTGDSRWITGTASRLFGHKVRNQVDAVLIGVGTVLADDPRLTCRIPGGRDPLRIVLDGHLRIPLRARLLRQREPEKTIVATGSKASKQKIEAIQKSGAQVWTFPLRKGTIPFTAILKRLGEMGLLSMMIEGGAVTAGRALKEKVVDKVLFFFAPRLIGGEGKDMIEALEIKQISRSLKLQTLEIKKFGKDFLASAYL